MFGDGLYLPRTCGRRIPGPAMCGQIVTKQSRFRLCSSFLGVGPNTVGIHSPSQRSVTSHLHDSQLTYRQGSASYSPHCAPRRAAEGTRPRPRQRRQRSARVSGRSTTTAGGQPVGTSLTPWPAKLVSRGGPHLRVDTKVEGKGGHLRIKGPIQACRHRVMTGPYNVAHTPLERIQVWTSWLFNKRCHIAVDN